MRAPSIRVLICVVLAAVAACGDNLRTEPESEVVRALDTMAPAQVAAGDPIAVTCTLHEDDLVTIISADLEVLAEDAVTRMGDVVIARQAGTITVACVLPAEALVDDTPAAVEIVAGAPANVITTVTPDPVTAGGTVTATCEVFDGSGNPITGTSPTLSLSPTDPGNTITDLTAEMTRAGPYTGRCVLPGTTSNDAAFAVIPALPATILLGRVPDFPIYAIGDNVQITHVVADRYGNEILGADVTKTSAPLTGVGPTVPFAPDMFRYDGEGSYRVTAVVAPPTDLDVPVTATVDILVNSLGPRIVCANDATMLNVTPGTMITVQGSTTDVNGVAGLAVNGIAVTVAGDGSFTAPVVTRFGLNFVDVTATDDLGATTAKVCTFLISNSWANPATPLSGAVSLKLGPSAIDDSDRAGEIDAFADILHAIVNSQGMKDTIHSGLLAANPLKPSSCDQQICVPFVGCTCVMRSRVTYLSSTFSGPNTVSMALVTGGVRAQTRINNIALRLRTDGQVSGIGFDTTGWVRLSYVDIALILDTTVTNGLPRMTVRAGSVTASVGSISTDFNGVDGWIIDNVIVPLAQGYLRDLVRDMLRTYVTSNFNTVLDGLISNLDTSTLGATFNVPRLDGSGSVTMGFGIAFSTLTSSTTRMLFGIGTRFTTTPANAFATLGAPLPPSTVLLDPTLTGNTAVAAHVGIFNQALHALWRGGYFAASIDGAVLGANVPAGVAFEVETRLPPVATISGTVVQLQLGAVDLAVTHPNLPADLAVRLGADAHATVSLVGNDLRFSGIVIDELYLSLDIVSLTATEQLDLETAMQTLAQQLVDQALNNALPALPIPAFTLPSSVTVFGLPAGRQLGINSPALTIAPQHFILRGTFGLRP